MTKRFKSSKRFPKGFLDGSEGLIEFQTELMELQGFQKTYKAFAEIYRRFIAGS